MTPQRHRDFFSVFSVSLWCIAVLLLVPVLLAHHGTGGIYDMEKSITLKGSVTMFKFVNPNVVESGGPGDRDPLPRKER
jgi:hypothetical protein